MSLENDKVSFSAKFALIDGPEAPRKLTKDNTTALTFGRSSHNDFSIADRYISKKHCRITLSGDDIELTDLDSRHGSRIFRPDGSTTKLEDESCQISLDEAQDLTIELGTSRLQIEEFKTEQTPPIASNPPSTAAPKTRSEIVTTQHQPRKTLAQTSTIPDSEHQLEVVFQLAGELNGLSRLEDILERISEAAFDAFSRVNFFAVTLLDTPSDLDELEDIEPYFTRTRDNIPADGPLLSRELLEKAMRNRENILFTKDKLGPEATESIINAQIEASLCSPLIGQERLLGAMQVDARQKGGLLTRKDLNLFSLLASHAAFSIERAHLSENIRDIFEQFIEASVGAIETRDATTAGHSRRVANFAEQLAKCVNNKDSGRFEDTEFSAIELQELEYAALLHDFGKIAVPERILNKADRLEPDQLRVIQERFEKIKFLQYRHLQKSDNDNCEIKRDFSRISQKLDEQLRFIEETNETGFVDEDRQQRISKIGHQEYTTEDGETKPYLTESEMNNLTIQKGTLNDDEWEKMQGHPERSREYLNQIPWGERFEDVPYIAGTHHEKLDGSGYPNQLDAEDIPLQTRILTIVDTYDALTSTNRSYRDAFSDEKAISILREEASEGRVDGDLVELFVQEILA